MNKQRMSNILSSVQMNPRDRKDFIEELSKLGQGEGGGGEVSTEHPVRIIELTQEEFITGKELDIHPSEFFNNEYKIKVAWMDDLKLDFIKSGMHIYSKSNGINIDTYYTTTFVSSDGSKTNMSVIVKAVYAQYGQSLRIDKGTFVNITDVINFSLPNTDIEYLINDIDQNSNYVVEYDRMLGNYYNGKFIGFGKGKIQVYDVNSETGEITEKLSIDIETLAGLEARIAALENPTTE